MASNKMTDAERRQLIDKLNKDTEDFIKKMQEKNKDYKYEDVFNDDNIDEILATHPAFMKEQPTAEEIENNPLLQGLQQIQYDPEDTPYDKAIAHKKDGNFQFKCKNYKLACMAYTEALKAKCDDVELLTMLYSNRAAANFYLKNYRSSLLDSSEAVNLSPQRIKSLLRCAQCCKALKRYQDAIDWCKIILSLEENNQTAKEIMNNCMKEKKLYERNQRKSTLAKEKELKKKNMTLQAIKDRKVRLECKQDSNSSDEEDLESSLQFLTKLRRVHLDDNHRLVWPVLLLYPEFETTDLIEQFHEDVSFQEILEDVFKEQAEWDTQNFYKVDLVKIFYENSDERMLYEVPLNHTLSNTLSHSSFVVKEATPNFFVLSTASEFYATFRSKWNATHLRC